MRHRLAQLLRRVATRLDGIEVMDARWHRLSVESMNKYIERTEAYIKVLEDFLTPSCIVCDALLEGELPWHCHDCLVGEEALEAHEDAPKPDIEKLRVQYQRGKPWIAPGSPWHDPPGV